MPGATIGGGVTHIGIYDTKYGHVWNVSGTVTQDDKSKAVTQDITANDTVKLSTDGSRLLGVLFTYEDRKVEGIKIGTVEHHGYFELDYTGTAPTLGHGVVGGANPGTVKGTGAAAVPGQPFIVSLDTVAQKAVVAFGIV